MKILLDENISWRIKKYLNIDLDKIIHVADISDSRLNDYEIWNYAKLNDCIILTHDSDFVDLVTLLGFPPKIIWLRTGNIEKLNLANKINENMLKIMCFYDDKELGILKSINPIITSTPITASASMVC